MPTPRRICVKGTSGAGKSTFAAELARRIDLPCIELDALFWGPNWTEPNSEAFRARVCEAMAAAPQGWVIDGNYDSRLGDTVLGAAEIIVWLDVPLHLKLRRVWGRTIYRIRNGVELWNGNRESWRDAFFSRESLLVWMIQTHFRHRREWPERFDENHRFVRLRSDAEISAWLEKMTSGATLGGC
jgi:adenylate kinase family enzyme